MKKGTCRKARFSCSGGDYEVSRKQQARGDGEVNGNQVTDKKQILTLYDIQGLEPEEEEDPDAYLMECWPDDPADIGLESVLKTIGPLFEQRVYQVHLTPNPPLIPSILTNKRPRRTSILVWSVRT